MSLFYCIFLTFACDLLDFVDYTIGTSMQRRFLEQNEGSVLRFMCWTLMGHERTSGKDCSVFGVLNIDIEKLFLQSFT